VCCNHNKIYKIRILVKSIFSILNIESR